MDSLHHCFRWFSCTHIVSFQTPACLHEQCSYGMEQPPQTHTHSAPLSPDALNIHTHVHGKHAVHALFPVATSSRVSSRRFQLITMGFQEEHVHRGTSCVGFDLNALLSWLVDHPDGGSTPAEQASAAARSVGFVFSFSFSFPSVCLSRVVACVRDDEECCCWTWQRGRSSFVRSLRTVRSGKVCDGGARKVS